MDNSEITVLSLFSGVAGLDLGLSIARPSRTLAYVEREAYAASILVARMESEALEPAPIWVGDIQDCDFHQFAGVDCICAGFPCTDISVAGKGAGIEGESSGLWREVVRAIREVRPREVFLENVAALTIRGLDRVLGDLAGLFYDAEGLCLRASEVGAPHQRNRMFILARSMVDAPRTKPGEGPGTWRGVCETGEAVANPGNGQLQESGRRQEGRNGTGSTVEELADTTHKGLSPRIGGQRSQDRPRAYSEELADTASSRHSRAKDAGTDSDDAGEGPRSLEPERACPELAGPAHRHQGRAGATCGEAGQSIGAGEDVEYAADDNRRGRECSPETGTRQDAERGRGFAEQGDELEHTNIQRPQGRGHAEQERIPEFTGTGFPPGPNGDWGEIPEWLHPAVKPGLRVRFDECPYTVDTSRCEQLRALGNAVVPIQASVAFTILMRRISQ